MITAEEARNLRPRVSLLERITDDIDRTIRNVGVAGRQEAEITAHIPNFPAWALARKNDKPTNPELDTLYDALVEAGYSIDMYEGGGARGRPYIRVSWRG